MAAFVLSIYSLILAVNISVDETIKPDVRNKTISLKENQLDVDYQWNDIFSSGSVNYSSVYLITISLKNTRLNDGPEERVLFLVSFPIYINTRW